MPDSSSTLPDECFHHVFLSKVASAILGGLPILFALFLVVGVVQRHDAGDKLGLLLFAAAFGALGILLLRFMFRPQVRLTATHLVVRHFFGARKYPYESLTGLGRYPRLIRPTKGPPFSIQMLVLRYGPQRWSETAFPAFRGNERLIQSLERRTGQKLVELENEAAARAWAESR